MSHLSNLLLIFISLDILKRLSLHPAIGVVTIGLSKQQSKVWQMKRNIFLAVVAAVGLEIAIKTNAAEALFMLFVAGVVPGTQYVIPANIMMLIMCAAISILLFRQAARDILRVILNRYAAQVNESSVSKRPLNQA